MRYAFIKCEDLSSAAFRGAEPVDRATWLCLLAWCYEQENGGRIKGARAWGDRRWQQTIAVTLEEVKRTTDLWHWDGDDLVVPLYDQAYVDQVRADSRQGVAGGKATSEAKAAAARANARKRWHGEQVPTDANGMPTPMPTDANGQMPNHANDAKPVCLSVCQSVRGGDAQERDPSPPTPPPLGQDDDPIRAVLASYGLPASHGAIDEWVALLTGFVVQCPADDLVAQAQALREILGLAIGRGVPIRYARDASRFAAAWRQAKDDTEKRRKQPPKAPEPPQPTREDHMRRRLRGDWNQLERDQVAAGRWHVLLDGSLVTRPAPADTAVLTVPGPQPLPPDDHQDDDDQPPMAAMQGAP